MRITTYGGKTCLCCRKPFSDANVFSDAGWREVKLSGMCEKCFDKLFEEAEQDE